MINDFTYRRMAITELSGSGVGTDDDGAEVLDSGADLPDEAAIEAEILRMKAADDAADLRSETKLRGVEIEGVMCSATGADQAGMLAIAYQHELMADLFVPTTMKFSNGTRLIINKDNFEAVRALWLPFRSSFYEES